MIVMISALEFSLKECGYPFEPGAGLKATQSVLFGQD
jgi:hypothetical protein